MVHFLQFFVLASCAASALAFPSVKRDIEEVNKHMTAIKSGMTAMHQAIETFPDNGGTLPQALKIHNGAKPLTDSLNAWTDATKRHGAFSAEDCASQIAAVEEFKPEILASLSGIITKRPSFESLEKILKNLLQLIKMDLTQLEAGTIAFADAMINACPEAQQGQPKETKAVVGEAFQKAIAAYA
ncbi:hypothetical protein HGRIS_000633 [Hohenbuehelia grisea]|uniref:Uncharacterized protein n=1 Tax=Hohenbuehelia grisea TaxID=104357 RepID=A0ABR3JS84_9AGAR